MVKVKELIKSPLAWAVFFAALDFIGVVQSLFVPDSIEADFMLVDFSIWTAAVLIIIAIRREKK